MISYVAVSFALSIAEPQKSEKGISYVLTLWRPTMNATFRLQGLTKEDQLVSMVRYSPLRAHILRGENSNGCPANWKTEMRQA